MRYRACTQNICQRLCEQLQMTVAPEAATGIARAYPVGSPTIVPVCEDPCAAVRDGAARYLLRQPFVAEIPVAIYSGVRTSRPVVRLKGCACARSAPLIKEEIP